MPAQSHATVWTAFMSPVEDEVNIGDVLIPNAAGDGYVVATLAARTAASRTTTAAGIALTSWNSTNPNRAVEIQTVGPCPQSVTGLSAGSATTVRVSDAGRLERGASSPLAGNCDADGFAYLNFTGSGSGGGGDTVTFSGDLSGPDAGPQVVERIKGTTVTTAGGALPVGAVLRTTAVGTADWGALDLADADARTGVLPTANGGTGLSSAGSDGNVLTASGGVWTSAAPASGAPAAAQYLTLATHASLSAERVFTPGTGLSATDGGANGNYTLNCTFTPSSTDTLTNKTFNIVSNNLVSTVAGQLLKGNGTVYDHFGGGTALQYLRKNAANTDLEWATLTTFTAPTGTGFMTTTSGSMNAASTNPANVSTYRLTDTSAAQYDLLVANGSAEFRRFAKGSNSTVLTTSSGGVVQWGTVTTAMMGGGSNGNFLGWQSGAAAWTNVAAYYGYQTSPATDGFLRGSNAVNDHTARNAAGSADVTLIMLGTDDNLYIGSNASDAERATGNRYNTASYHYFSVAGSFYTLMQSGVTAVVSTNASFFDSAGSFNSMTGVIFIKNRASGGCSGGPTGGGILYANGGAGVWNGSGGTYTTFGPADPHCQKCGRDFVHEWFNPYYDERLVVCMACLLGALESLGVNVDAFSVRSLQ